MTNTETFLLISLVLNVGLVVHAAMLISLYLGERRNAQMWRNAYTDDVIVNAEIAGAARALGIDKQGTGRIRRRKRLEPKLGDDVLAQLREDDSAEGER